MQTPAPDLAEGFAAWAEAKRRDLRSELDALRERMAAIETELARFDGAQALMAEFLAHGRAVTEVPDQSADALVGPVDAPRATTTPSTPPSRPRDAGTRIEAVSEGTLAQRIAAIAVQQPERTWTSRDFAVLLFGDEGGQQRARQETVRKTLQRMERRGHMSRDGASLYGATDRTGEALKG